MVAIEVLFIGKEILDFETTPLKFLKNMLGVKQQKLLFIGIQEGFLSF